MAFASQLPSSNNSKLQVSFNKPSGTGERFDSKSEEMCIPWGVGAGQNTAEREGEIWGKILREDESRDVEEPFHWIPAQEGVE